MQRREKTKENEREKLFQMKRKGCAQKVFDRVDIVRDVRLRRVNLPSDETVCFYNFLGRCFLGLWSRIRTQPGVTPTQWFSNGKRCQGVGQVETESRGNCRIVLNSNVMTTEAGFVDCTREGSLPHLPCVPYNHATKVGVAHCPTLLVSRNATHSR